MNISDTSLWYYHELMIHDCKKELELGRDAYVLNEKAQKEVAKLCDFPITASKERHMIKLNRKKIASLPAKNVCKNMS